MKGLILTSLALLMLAGCKEEVAELPEPFPLTEENVSFFCQMNVLEHGGPKAQVHLEGFPTPLFFAQVRDAVAYLKSPERDARVLGTYVSDMGVAPAWNEPGTENWVNSTEAVFVIDAGVAGGMGAPEIVPFLLEEDALEFVETYGGRLASLADIPESLVLGPVDPEIPLQEPE